jgi:hypothetical protein
VLTGDLDGETMTAPQALVAADDDKPTEALAAGVQSRISGGNGGDVGGGDALEVSTLMARLAARTQCLCQLALTLTTMRDRQAVCAHRPSLARAAGLSACEYTSATSMWNTHDTGTHKLMDASHAA